jgi:ribosomal protein S18 acetylase RimI-like enzyme
MPLRINFAESQSDFDISRLLFLEYAETLGFSLCFQGFDEELENLPGKYATPKGCILLAWDKLDCGGCVGLRPLNDTVCEMKRLYIKPAYRGTGLGRLLAEKILKFANESNYSKIVLDTLSSMDSAQGLYRSLGFAETDPYYHNPHPDVVFFEKKLTDPK